MKPKICFAVGGSGGHLLPALKLREQLKNQCDIALMGVGLKEKNLTGEVFSVAGSPLLFKKPFGSLFALSKGVKESMQLLKKERPRLVVGFGSFHSFPVVTAAKMLKIPYILYEQNQITGRVNRLFSKGALFTAHPFDFAGKIGRGECKTVSALIHNKKTDREVALTYFGLKRGEDVLLVFGGSQGANRLNKVVAEWASKHKKKLQIIHLVGRGNNAIEVQKAYQEANMTCCVKEYEEHMDLAWSAASYVIARSGANTILEMLEYEVPGILVPYPFDKDGHQKANALWMAERVGGAIVLEEGKITSEQIKEKLEEIEEGLSDFIFCMKSYKKRLHPKELSELILTHCLEKS